MLPSTKPWSPLGILNSTVLNSWWLKANLILTWILYMPCSPSQLSISWQLAALVSADLPITTVSTAKVENLWVYPRCSCAPSAPAIMSIGQGLLLHWPTRWSLIMLSLSFILVPKTQAYKPKPILFTPCKVILSHPNPKELGFAIDLCWIVDSTQSIEVWWAQFFLSKLTAGIHVHLWQIGSMALCHNTLLMQLLCSRTHETRL